MNRKSGENIVHKTVDFKIKQITEDDQHFYFEGYASVFNQVDWDGDLIDPAAFTTSINKIQAGQLKIKALWAHSLSEPVGVFTDIKADSHGLFVKGRMPKDDDFVAKRVMPQMRVGSVDSMSIGFYTLDYAVEKGTNLFGNTNANICRIFDLMLLEISLVPLPSNPGARVTAVKTVVPFGDLPLAPDDREWDSDAAISRLRSFLESEESPSGQYKRAFLWYDQENADNFGAYKLPIADVIDGQLVAVPRAIFAAAAAMNGARGGVDVPDTDRAGIMRHIERYYRKMGRESPFQTRKLSLEDVKNMTERDFEGKLRKGAVFSQLAAKALVSVTASLRDVDEQQREVEPMPEEQVADYLARIEKALGRGAK